MRRLAALAILVALAAGCGGSGGRLSKSQYEARIGAIGRDVSSRILNFKPTNFSGVEAYFGGMAHQLDDVAKEAKAIEPPRDVQDIHSRIVDGLEKEAAAVHAFADRLKGATVTQVKAVLRSYDWTSFRAALQELNDAGDALAARGYTVRTSAGT